MSKIKLIRGRSYRGYGIAVTKENRTFRRTVRKRPLSFRAAFLLFAKSSRKTYPKKSQAS